MSRRQVVLIGAGHAHLEVLRAARRFKGIADLTIVDPGDFHYSGQASATLGGSIATSDNCVDVGRLAVAKGARRVRTRACGIDRRERTVLLEDGGSLAYDCLSFNIGSVTRGLNAPFGRAVPVKPIAGLAAVKASIEAEGRQREQRIVVAGGGPTGVEIAGNLLHLSDRLARSLRVTLVGSQARLLANAPERASGIAEANLRRRGATLLLEHSIDAVGDGVLALSGKTGLAFDRLVVATGLLADPLMAGLGLPVTRTGGLHVDATLRSIEDARVFAVGDCAAIDGRDLPKIGVYAVRAAPVLLENLLAALTGAPMRRFRPQRRYLSIIDLGDGTGLALWDGLVLHGRAMLGWKRRIDRRFLDRFR